MREPVIISVALEGIVKLEVAVADPEMVQVVVFPDVHVPPNDLHILALSVGVFPAYAISGARRTATEDTAKRATRTNMAADFIFMLKFSPWPNLAFEVYEAIFGINQQILILPTKTIILLYCETDLVCRYRFLLGSRTTVITTAAIRMLTTIA